MQGDIEEVEGYLLKSLFNPREMYLFFRTEWWGWSWPSPSPSPDPLAVVHITPQYLCHSFLCIPVASGTLPVQLLVTFTQRITGPQIIGEENVSGALILLE